MRRWVLAAFAGAAAVMGVGPATAADCKLRMFSAKMIENNNGAILISAGLGDKPAIFMIDTGSFWSTIRFRNVGNLKIQRAAVAGVGAGGNRFDTFVKEPSFKIGPGEINDVDFMVVPDGMSTDERVDGVIGANFLHNFDLELDLAANTVNFFIPSGCGAAVVHWPNNGYVALPLTETRTGLIRASLQLDGKPVKTLIDTGATTTILSLRAADELFGLHSDSPGVEASGTTRTMDGQNLPLYRRQFGTLDFGGVLFHNPWLTLAEDRVSPHSDNRSDPDDLILGTHQLRQLHIYIAYKDKMLYATASAGPAVDAAAGAAPVSAIKKLDPLDARLLQPLMQSADKHMRDNQPDLALQDLDEAIRRYPNVALPYYDRATVIERTKGEEAALAELDRATAVDPNFIPAYQLRVAILRMLHRYPEARVDLDKMVALTPSSSAAYVERGWMRGEFDDDSGAMSDFDKAIELDSKQVAAHRGRAGILGKQGNFPGAQAELDQAMAINANDPAVYESRAILQAKQHAYSAAIAEIDHAITLAPQSAGYLNNRCWYRAIQGELDQALLDCNRALELDPRSAPTLDSIGFIKLKQHHPADAIADYNAALAIKPDQAGSLYGRGLAKQARGDAKGGKADLVAAEKLRPDVVDTYGR